MDLEYPALLSALNKADREIPNPNKMHWSQALEAEAPAGHRKVHLHIKFQLHLYEEQRVPVHPWIKKTNKESQSKGEDSCRKRTKAEQGK
jgi:hypothetical protein